MARRKQGTDPSYRLHKSSGQAIVSLPRGDGTYRDYLLGPFDSPESRDEYDRIIAEWKANGRRAEAYPDTTVAEMCAAFMEHAKVYYRRPDGSQTGEAANFKATFAPLLALYAHHEARRFDTVALEAVRQRMIDAGLSRKVINQRVMRIKSVFKWAAPKKMVPAAVYQELRPLAALAEGRSAARDTEPVTPVLDEHVDAVFPHLLPPTRAIVELLRLTGARPGEIVQMRRADIDMSGEVWLYRPVQHKNRWRKKPRVIAIGPKAQAIVREFFKPDFTAPLFSPRDAIRHLWKEQRAKRRSKVFPCEKRDQERRLKQLSERYTVSQLDQAIRRACDKAGVPRWSANRLRHSHATLTRKRFGLESSAAVLGHANLSTTEIYAEKDLGLAVQVAAAIG